MESFTCEESAAPVVHSLPLGSSPLGESRESSAEDLCCPEEEGREAGSASSSLRPAKQAITSPPSDSASFSSLRQGGLSSPEEGRPPPASSPFSATGSAGGDEAASLSVFSPSTGEQTPSQWLQLLASVQDAEHERSKVSGAGGARDLHSERLPLSQQKNQPPKTQQPHKSQSSQIHPPQRIPPLSEAADDCTLLSLLEQSAASEAWSRLRPKTGDSAGCAVWETEKGAVAKSEVSKTASASAHSTSGAMVKSVSPAGVLRIGGRNRRKRTKYDLAYRQMESLSPFAEEAKHADLSKVSSSSFALELLQNPDRYSYDAWEYGLSWPVGADGRRLLLRKLRGVYWSNPEKWQRVLQEHNLYRRDLFTLATVQELFKVSHLMGPEVWDFLLKCTALTHKCEALATKEPDSGGGAYEEEAHSSSAGSPPSGVPLKVDGHSTSARVSNGEEGNPAALSTSDFFTRASYRGFLKKRSASRVREREGAKKGRGNSATLTTAAKTAERERRRSVQTEPALGNAFWRRPSVSWLSSNDGDEQAASASWQKGSLGATPRAAAASGSASSLKRSLPLSRVANSAAEKGRRRDMDGTVSSSSHAQQNPLQLAAAESPENCAEAAALLLSSHYAFMAQFLQCCMLAEAQQTLLALLPSAPAAEGPGGTRLSQTENARQTAPAPTTEEGEALCASFTRAISQVLRLQSAGVARLLQTAAESAAPEGPALQEGVDSDGREAPFGESLSFLDAQAAPPSQSKDPQTPAPHQRQQQLSLNKPSEVRREEGDSAEEERVSSD